MKNDKTINEFDYLFHNYVDELINLSDEEILNSDEENIIEKTKENVLSIIKSAKQEAGKRRLNSARASFDKLTLVTNELSPSISPQEARQILASATNDPLLTLAARKYDELTDAEVLKLYAQYLLLKNSK